MIRGPSVIDLDLGGTLLLRPELDKDSLLVEMHQPLLLNNGTNHRICQSSASTTHSSTASTITRRCRGWGRFNHNGRRDHYKGLLVLSHMSCHRLRPVWTFMAPMVIFQTMLTLVLTQPPESQFPPFS
jgi:hypothetical protein